MARPSRALLLQSLLFLVALPTEAQTPASVASSVASTTATSDRAYQNTTSWPGLPAKCLQGSRASETEKWCVTVTTNSHLGDSVHPGSECPAHPSVNATFVNQDDCPEEASCCCFSSKIDCGKMATAYNDRHSPRVSEICQFYTLNATNETLATCEPACLNHINFLQYPLRLPGPTGGKPGSCAEFKKCPNGGDKLRCCSSSTITSWNRTRGRNNITGSTVADTCTNKVSCTYNDPPTYTAHDPDSPATYGMLVKDGPAMRRYMQGHVGSYMHRPMIAGPPIGCSPSIVEGPDAEGPVTILVISISLVLLTALVLCLYICRYKRSLGESLEEHGMSELLLSRHKSRLEHFFRAWLIRIDEIELHEQLGKGSFGVVYSGEWLGKTVAVKVITPTELGPGRAQAATAVSAALSTLMDSASCQLDIDSKRFDEEAETMIHLHHPHLVSFYGAGRLENGSTFLVTELMAKGTLAELLADHFATFSWAEKRSFAIDIASGMLFLHTRRPPMVHRDLKADNVLVSAAMVIKICDFGTAARLQAEVLEEQLAVATDAAAAATPEQQYAYASPATPEHQYAYASPGKHGVHKTAAKAPRFKPAKTLAVKGSPLWMAPELLVRGGGRSVTTANDVYSYGHVVYEICSGFLPFQEPNGGWPFSGANQLYKMVVDGERPKIPIRTPQMMKHLMEQCWLANPTDRPNFKTIIGWLKSVDINAVVELERATAMSVTVPEIPEEDSEAAYENYMYIQP